MAVLEPTAVLAFKYSVGDLVVWDELCGVFHSTSLFGPDDMTGNRLHRKLPPGGTQVRGVNHRQTHNDATRSKLEFLPTARGPVAVASAKARVLVDNTLQ